MAVAVAARHLPLDRHHRHVLLPLLQPPAPPARQSLLPDAPRRHLLEVLDATFALLLQLQLQQPLPLRLLRATLERLPPSIRRSENTLLIDQRGLP